MKFFRVSPESKKSYPVTEKDFTEALLKNNQLKEIMAQEPISGQRK